MVDFGLSEAVQSPAARLALSMALVAMAVLVAYLVRKARHRLPEREHPIILDLVTSLLLLGLMVATILAIADLWGQTAALLDRLGLFDLDTRASQVVLTIAVLVAIQVTVGIVRRLLADLTGGERGLTDHQREIVMRTSQLILWGSGFVIVLGLWSIDLAGLLVGAGFLGIVVGLAARETLASLLAGFILMFSRPFQIGDWVVVGEHEGTVTDITLMSTRLAAPNGEFVVVPNDRVSNETVVNRSRNGQIRLEVDVGVDYETDLERARELATGIVTELAGERNRLRDHPAPDVIVREFADSAVVLRIRVWVSPPEPVHMNEMRHAVVAAVKAAFEAEGIKIPYPQRELSGRAETGGFRVADVDTEPESTDDGAA